MNKGKYSLEQVLEIINGMNFLERVDAIQLIVDKLSGDSFVNDDLKRGIDKHVSKVMYSKIDMLYALSQYLKDEGYDMNDMFEYGAGDRKVCYLGEYDNREVMYMKNQNMEMVVVIENSYTKKLHIRLVYPEIENCPFYDVEEISEKMRTEKDNVQYAISKLTSPYHQHNYADSYATKEYPHKISLKTMIENKFKKGTPVFRYEDARDKNYVYSTNIMSDNNFSGNMSERGYLLEEVMDIIKCEELPKDWFKKYMREEKLKDIMD